MFTVKSAWNALRTKGVLKEWRKILWLSPNIPKFSFVAWVSAHRGLTTLDRIKRWGFHIPNYYNLCKCEKESIDHSFFICGFSKAIWKSSLERIGILANDASWDGWLSWVSKVGKGKEVKAKIVHMVFCASIYFIWKERNQQNS